MVGRTDPLCPMHIPRINRDLSATFRVQADQAHKVQVLMEFGQSAFDIVKGEDGYWSVMTTPLLPGFHYYAISVDGFPANDPGSRVFFAAERSQRAGSSRPRLRFLCHHGCCRTAQRMLRTAHGVASGTSRKRQARRDGFSFISPRDTIRVGCATRSFIFSTGMEKTKAVGRTRAMRTCTSLHCCIISDHELPAGCRAGGMET